MPDETLTPQQRIELAEAEEVEAMRDILKAQARSAVATAQIMENLVEFDQSLNHAIMSLSQQGPLPTNSLPKWAVEAAAKYGPEIIGKVIEWGIKKLEETLSGTAEKQKADAEQQEQNNKKEQTIKNGKTNLFPDNTLTSITSGGGGSSIAPVTGSSTTSTP